MPVPMPEVERPNSTVARLSAQCFATMITAVREHSPSPTPVASAKLQIVAHHFEPCLNIIMTAPKKAANIVLLR